jgi:3-oxoacyl-[acyl-carrier protein] reductase
VAGSPVMIVSGGSRGLGRALVESYLARGWNVATFSRSLTPFVEQCQKEAPDFFYWSPVDASDPAAVRCFAKQVIGHFGRVDALVNNAGCDTDGILSTMRSEDVTRTVNVNLESALHLTSGCLRAMLAQGAGAIVNISSVSGLRGHTGVTVYSATKAALDGFTRSLAREVGPAGIRVNSVAPGYFESSMTAGFGTDARNRIVRRTPLGRLGRAEDIVSVVHFLVSPEAGFITGQVIAVDGGLSC